MPAYGTPKRTWSITSPCDLTIAQSHNLTSHLARACNCAVVFAHHHLRREPMQRREFGTLSRGGCSPPTQHDFTRP